MNFGVRTVASIALLWVVGASAAVAQKGKVDICHYQPETNSWKLLSVGSSAEGSHLGNHDDATPGGTTSQTGTQLTADCAAAGGDESDSCGDCLTEHAGPGCENAACEAQVCALDSFCCNVEWDSSCVFDANADCAGNVCTAP
jgi:hypothetical protein